MSMQLPLAKEGITFVAPQREASPLTERPQHSIGI
jgi:hypothetical protein